MIGWERQDGSESAAPCQVDVPEAGRVAGQRVHDPQSAKLGMPAPERFGFVGVAGAECGHDGNVVAQDSVVVSPVGFGGDETRRG